MNKKRILVINGPNLNLLGTRETDVYGSENYDKLVSFIKEKAEKFNLQVEIFQSNHEGEIIDKIQQSIFKCDGIVINAAGYSHTSVAILDALKAVALPVVEVHLTDISKREPFRKFSYISFVAKKVIIGKGFVGYAEALEYFANNM